VLSASGRPNNEAVASGVMPTRLRRPADVRRVIREGRRVPERWIVLHVLPGEAGVRSAFVASRRVGGAVVRNQARRRMKEAWRQVAPSPGRGFDVVFVARPEIPQARTQDLIPSMRQGLVRAGVMEP
jgi:ribonuclease P protein component